MDTAVKLIAKDEGGYKPATPEEMVELLKEDG
jgi:hypothetical protein